MSYDIYYISNPENYALRCKTPLLPPQFDQKLAKSTEADNTATL